MRPALAPLALALAGCLSAPTGLDPSTIDAADAPIDGRGGAWPPAGAQIRAIAGGAIDDDTMGDLALLSTGPTPGVYLLRGGVDVTLDGATTYTAFAPIPALTPPVAIAAGADRIVVLEASTNGHVWIFDETLAPVDDFAIGAAAPIPTTAAVWARFSSFGPGSAVSVMLAVPGRLAFVEDVAGTPVLRAIDPAAAPTLDDQPRLLDAWSTGGGGFVTADLTHVHGGAAPAPPPPDPVFSFTELRNGTAWPSQTTSDLGVDGTFDGVPDVIGFDPDGANPARLCVERGGTTPQTDPTCLPTTFLGNDRVQLLLEEIGGQGMQRDAILLHAHPNGNDTQLCSAANLAITSGAVATTMLGTCPVTITGYRNAVATSANTDAVMIPELWLASESGELRCYILGPTQLEPCP